MTQLRRDDREETPFGAWVRAQPGLHAVRDSFVATDVDWIFQKYRPQVKDAIGTRDVQLMMMVELKCHNREPDNCQAEMLSFTDQVLWPPGTRLGRKVRRQDGSFIELWHFGVYVLSLSGTSPANSVTCDWGKFLEDGRLAYRRIPTEDVPRILGFEKRPDTLEKLSLRRHHLDFTFYADVTTPLGFLTRAKITRSS